MCLLEITRWKTACSCSAGGSPEPLPYLLMEAPQKSTANTQAPGCLPTEGCSQSRLVSVLLYRSLLLPLRSR